MIIICNTTCGQYQNSNNIIIRIANLD
uniref:Uncharacterized protein n=1 Tax=Rhizophora mucronata TaxID=61149 RepID=A0A2P2R3D8_RHIMU